VRIIAGERRGARISAPKGLATRPTGDRTREAAFNLIGPVDDAAVLDLFAGSGAMGLEALSRGARRCVFVESDRAACAVIRSNLEKLRLTRADIRCQDAFQALRVERSAGRRYDLVIADPPYEAWAELELRLGEALPPALAADGLLVVETSARVEPQLPLTAVTSRRYGSARITLFTR
jgi:16S rRNA (guanine966-N2)-methyltransferase